jgi:hypothetical protein
MGHTNRVFLLNEGGWRTLGVGAGGSFFDRHVLELGRFEDIAALEALHKLGVLFAGYDPHARMLALFHANAREGRLSRW